MANVKISDLTPIDLSYISGLTPFDTMPNLYLVGDFTYFRDGEGTTETGGIDGATLIAGAGGIWDYLTYIPEGKEDSIFSEAVYPILEPYLSENFSSLLTIYMPDYLSEIYSADEYYGLLAVTASYEMIRVNAESIIQDYLNNFMPLPCPASSLDDPSVKVLFVDNGLSYIYNVTLSDLVSYIKSH